MRSIVAAIAVSTALLCATEAGAATYYLRSGGKDTADGLSPATAWATLARLDQATLRAGDRVLLHEGDRFAGQLRFDWGGTASAPGVVGAYYLDNGAPRVGYKTSRPIIDGQGKTIGQYDGLVRLRGSYARIENIAVVNSTGRGIDAVETAYVEIVQCLTDKTYKNGILFRDSTHPSIRGNTVSFAIQSYPATGNAGGGGIELVRTTDGVVAGNTLNRVYGEGINANEGSARTVIEDNYVFGVRSVGIYVDAAPYVTVRRNVVIGTADSEFWRDGNGVGPGIVLNNEAYHYDDRGLSPSVQTQHTRVYDNLIAGTNAGIAIWGAFQASSFDDVLIFSNTLVDNDLQTSMSSMPKPGAKFIDNILLSITAGTADVGGTKLGGMVARNNYFSRGNPGGDFASATNKFSGLTLARMSNWRSALSTTQLSWRDFVVQKSSSVIGAGDDEPQRLADGADTFDRDFTDAPHNTPMDLGALRFVPGVARPKAPRSLALAQ
jgi:hypothetical protein